MKREWKPGDVALVEAGCWANRKVALRLAEGWSHANGVSLDADGVVSVVRPLVVIDPEDREQVERLAKAYAALSSSFAELMDEPWTMPAMRMRQALREFANPKPEEPTDPKAHVTDRRENMWRLLADGDWVCTSGPDIGEYLTWGRLAAERGPLSIEARP